MYWLAEWWRHGALSSAAGTGGALRLEATRIYNHGKLEARAGNGAKLSSVDQTRDLVGGRIAFLATGQIKVGAIDVSGEWLSTRGPYTWEETTLTPHWLPRMPKSPSTPPRGIFRLRVELTA